MDEKGTAVVKKATPTSIDNVVDPTLAREMLKSFAKERKTIIKFIGKQLIEGVDYGYAYYDDRGRPQGKKMLLKPGAEKFDMFLRLDPVFVNDRETWEMMGSEPGLVCFACFLLTKAQKKEALKLLEKMGRSHRFVIYQNLAVAEGRGARSKSEVHKGTRNTTIKMAQKSAQVDSTLRVAGLSEMFSQDAEDFVPQPRKQQPPQERDVTPPVKKANGSKDPRASWSLAKLLEACKKALEPMPEAQQIRLDNLAEERFNNRQHGELLHLLRLIETQAKQFGGKDEKSTR